jgi:hypothetical protein
MPEDLAGGDSPRSSDSLRVPPASPPRPFSPARTRLHNFLAAMNASGEDAEEQYRTALKELQAEADLVLVEIARAENDCDRRDYPLRWGLVHAASELRTSAALPFLRSLVLRPIPPEESTDPHSFSSVAEETILRTTAVEGVGLLAARDNRAALDALFEFLEVDSLSVRRAAVRSLLSSPRARRQRNRIMNALPENQRFLLDLQPLDVGDAPQVKRPQRHLSEKGRRARVPPAPGLPSEQVEIDTRDEKGPSTRA